MPPVGFLLGAPLTGLTVLNIHSEPIGNRNWLVMWTSRIEITGQSVFVINMNGRHLETVINQTRIQITAPDKETPLIEIIQCPIHGADPGFFPSYFPTVQLPNKAIVTWTPPASVSNVKFYRIYWDNGTGTVGFTDADVVGEVVENGSTSYTFRTRSLVTGTYKFVIRTVSFDGELETTNTTPELSITVTNFIAPISAETITYDFATKKATLTWTNPAGASAIRIFDNLGDPTSQFPDYNVILASLGLVTTFVTAALLFPKVYAFGIRVSDGTNFELNTSITLKLRLDSSGAEISNFPVTPSLSGELEGSGKIRLVGGLDENPDDIHRFTPATDIQFFTNDGAGGAIDFSTPIATVSFTSFGSGLKKAEFLTAAFGATQRLFSARARTSGGIISEDADTLTITPNTTVPAVVLTPAAVAGR